MGSVRVKRLFKDSENVWWALDSVAIQVSEVPAGARTLALVPHYPRNAPRKV
jgi:hypothetical protein